MNKRISMGMKISLVIPHHRQFYDRVHLECVLFSGSPYRSFFAILELMLPQCVENAIQFFKIQNPTEISREAVMAYSTLKAVEHYYFDRVTPEIAELTCKYSWVRDQEPGRVIKQKRIMSWVISREMQAQTT